MMRNYGIKKGDLKDQPMPKMVWVLIVLYTVCLVGLLLYESLG